MPQENNKYRSENNPRQLKGQINELQKQAAELEMQVYQLRLEKDVLEQAFIQGIIVSVPYGGYSGALKAPVR